MLNDNFLISFAISVLVAISFFFQHLSNNVGRRLKVVLSIKKELQVLTEKKISLIFLIVVYQLISISIIIEIINYFKNESPQLP